MHAAVRSYIVQIIILTDSVKGSFRATYALTVNVNVNVTVVVSETVLQLPQTYHLTASETVQDTVERKICNI